VRDQGQGLSEGLPKDKKREIDRELKAATGSNVANMFDASAKFGEYGFSGGEG
jgi:hypothetical protein